MDVEYSEELKSYMARKGYRDIIIETYCAHTCTGQQSLTVRPLGEKESQRLHERGAHHLRGELGDVFVGPSKLLLNEEGGLDAPVRLGIKSFLGAKEITVEGLRPQGMLR